MEKLDLVAIQPRSFKPRTTISKHRLGYSPNLLAEGLFVAHCNQVWVGDITYVGLRSRFAYLAMLMDLYPREIICWEIDLTMTQRLTLAALHQAIRQRQPQPGLIHHTDRGGKYAGAEYRAVLSQAEMQQSMGRPADCYDNAFMELCFGAFKTELEMTCYASIDYARREIEEYISYCNAISRQSSLDYQSPTSSEIAHQT